MDALLTFLLKHPARVWERGELVWSPVVPGWALGAVALLAVAEIGRAHV